VMLCALICGLLWQVSHVSMCFGRSRGWWQLAAGQGACKADGHQQSWSNTGTCTSIPFEIRRTSRGVRKLK
jgi:hypothetical protein